MTLILLLLFISSISAECSIARIIQCASTWYDWDHDGNITEAEIKRFMIEKPCGPPIYKFMGSTVIHLCDTNDDGVLTSEDISCIETNNSILEAACVECDRCDNWYNETRV